MNTPDDVSRILGWPRETRSEEEVRRLVEYRAVVHREMWNIADLAERDDRDLTSDERQQFEELDTEFRRLSPEVPSSRR